MPNRPPAKPARRAPMTERERHVYNRLWEHKDSYGIDHRVLARKIRVPVRSFYTVVGRIKSKGYKLPSGIPGNMLHRGPGRPVTVGKRMKSFSPKDELPGMEEALAKAGITGDPIMEAFLKLFGPPMKIRSISSKAIKERMEKASAREKALEKDSIRRAMEAYGEIMAKPNNPIPLPSRSSPCGIPNCPFHRPPPLLVQLKEIENMLPILRGILRYL